MRRRRHRSSLSGGGKTTLIRASSRFSSLQSVGQSLVDSTKRVFVAWKMDKGRRRRQLSSHLAYPPLHHLRLRHLSHPSGGESVSQTKARMKERGELTWPWGFLLAPLTHSLSVSGDVPHTDGDQALSRSGGPSPTWGTSYLGERAVRSHTCVRPDRGRRGD